MKNSHQQARHQICSDAMRGLFITETLRPGLSLHATDLEVFHPMQNEGRVEPGLRLILMLKGKMEVNFGKQALTVHGEQADHCLLLSIAEEERMQRTISQPGGQSQIVLTISEHWLEEGGLCHLPGYSQLQHFCHTHLAQSLVQSSSRLKSLAHALLHPPEVPAFLQKLQSECRALELISSALGQFSPNTLKHKELAKIEQLTAILKQPGAEPLSLNHLAKTLGSNPSTLQRLFKTVHGTSIIDFARKERLNEARHLLINGASVLDAAIAAGYQSPGNFSTAFKRHFGYPPRETR